MKLKLCLLSFLLILTTGIVEAADPGLRYINTRGMVRCGTPNDNKIFAYKDDDGVWQGISVEMCRIISTAIFGRSDRIKMVQVPEVLVSKALATNKIDVMIGGMSYSATHEISSKAAPVDIIYYDRMVFLSRDTGKAKSMEDFKGEKVCIVKDPDDLKRLMAYSDHYKLDLVPAPFQTASSAKANFLLKRCRLLTGNYMLLQDILLNTPGGLDNVEMLPETIDERPVYLFTLKSNTTLRIVLKWIMNAMKFAEDVGLTQENYSMNLSSNNPEIRNLLGIDDKLWNRFRLEPNWVQIMLKERGNYGEVFEKVLGEKSRFKIKRGKNNLLKNGGLITSEPFL